MRGYPASASRETRISVPDAFDTRYALLPHSALLRASPVMVDTVAPSISILSFRARTVDAPKKPSMSAAVKTGTLLTVCVQSAK